MESRLSRFARSLLRLELTMVASPTPPGIVLTAFGGIGVGFDGKDSAGGFGLGGVSVAVFGLLGIATPVFLFNIQSQQARECVSDFSFDAAVCRLYRSRFLLA